MTSHLRHEDSPRRAGASLTSIIEEAIAETLTPPPLAQAGPAEPVGVEGFLADAAAFLRVRPDADALLQRLQAMIGAAQEPSFTPSPPPEPAGPIPPLIVVPDTDPAIA